MKVKNITPEMLVDFIVSNSLEFNKEKVYEIAKTFVYTNYKKPSQNQVYGLRNKLNKNFEQISNLLSVRSLSGGIEHETIDKKQIEETEQT